MGKTSKSTNKATTMATSDPKQEYSFPSSFPILPKKGRFSKSKKQASYGKKNRNSNDPVSEEQKAWGFIRVIPPSSEEKVVCDAEGCDKTAVVLWETREAPLKVWKGCERCQAAKFGGWSQGAKPPSETNLARPSKSALDSVATAKALYMEGSVSKNDAQESGIVGVTSIGATSAASCVTGKDEEDEEGWDMVQILSAESFLKHPTQCSICEQLPACAVYVSNLNPKQKCWYCLDCQEEDFGGWPETLEELPLQSLSKEHMAAMSKHCSKERHGYHRFPDFDNDGAFVVGVAETNAVNRKRNNGLVTPSPHPPTTASRASKNNKNSEKTVPLLSSSVSNSPFRVTHRVFHKGYEEPSTPEPKIVFQQPAFSKRLKLRNDHN